MSELVEHLYFNWLCARVVDMKAVDSHPDYWKLLTHLHKTEFVWMMLGDNNRAMDGKELRREFILLEELPDDEVWRVEIGCSVLEMLIAFSRRAEFQDDTPTYDWFWEFIRNLGLEEFTDNDYDPQAVEDILQRFIWRTYDSYGNGGMFPIRNPYDDQRDLEIWHQFCEYMVDQERIP